jgi:hypothetical protein
MAKSAKDIVGLVDKPKIERNSKGQFLTGHKQVSPGRPKGSRNILTTQFLDDLAASWEKHGIAALDACAQLEPAQYIRVVAGLLPKEAMLQVSVDTTLHVAQSAAQAFAVLRNLPKNELIELKARNAVDAE